MSLQWLLDVFLPQHPEVDRATTNEVMLNIVRRETQADQCRYTDLLLRSEETKGAVSQVGWGTRGPLGRSNADLVGQAG